MSSFQRILIGMDLSEMDRQLLDHLSLYTGGAEPPKLHFLHVAYELQLPVMIGGRYTRELQDLKVDDRFREEMIAEVTPKLNPEHFDAEFHVIEGTITRQLLHYANERHIDLTVMGRKKHPAGTGVASHRYLRGSEGSVLFVPEDRPAKMDKVVVATDFSEYSEQVIRHSLELIREQRTLPELHLVNVYDVPTDMAYRISRTEDQFAEIIRENVESVVPQFIEKFDLEGIKYQFKLIQNQSYNAAEHLVSYCREHDADLLILGARGHSVVSALLLGSVAERVLRYNEDTPLLIMRS